MEAAGLVLLLLLAILDPGTVQGKVVPDFDECSWFFQDKIPPQGFETPNRVRICQRYKNHYHFVTLYRPDLRIPVYSAYRYPCTTGESEGHTPSPWFYEPQIDDANAADEMESCEAASSQLQAVNDDYEGSGYHRGQLYPFALNRKESATGSCTLTNAVPKSQEANIEWHDEAESVAQKLAQICHKSGRSMYLVTGADNASEQTVNDRVSVPGLVWTALCCTSPQSPDPCLNEDMGAEEEDVATYDKDFSLAFMQQMESGAKVERLMVREVQGILGVGKIFDSCRGTSEDDEAENFKEVEGLVEEIAPSADDQETEEDHSPPIPTEDSPAADANDLAMEQADTPLEPADEVDEGVCQSTTANALAPIGRMISLVVNGVLAFVQLIAAVFNIIRVLTVTILSVPVGIIQDSACCLAIMVHYLIVTVASVPQDLLSIVASIISDTAGAISWSTWLIKYLVRIL
uniref:endonuclease domain-containing 1 protein-like n=1 Tax=Pristiophorus japonicus TaxID=55135 RepID=UPI00398F2320